MKLLLDTHIILWSLADDPQLPTAARDLIEDESNEIYYSIAAVWETEIKYLLHSQSLKIDGKELTGYCREAGFSALPIHESHIFAMRRLRRKEGSPPHKDPFDRIMLCQAMVENMKFLTHDSLLPDYQLFNVLHV